MEYQGDFFSPFPVLDLPPRHWVWFSTFPCTSLYAFLSTGASYVITSLSLFFLWCALSQAAFFWGCTESADYFTTLSLICWHTVYLQPYRMAFLYCFCHWCLHVPAFQHHYNPNLWVFYGQCMCQRLCMCVSVCHNASMLSCTLVMIICNVHLPQSVHQSNHQLVRVHISAHLQACMWVCVSVKCLTHAWLAGCRFLTICEPNLYIPPLISSRCISQDGSLHADFPNLITNFVRRHGSSLTMWHLP